MNIKRYIKIYSIIAIIFISILFSSKIEASSMILNQSKESYDILEQFYLDVLVDTNGEEINGIEGKISFSNNLKFIRAEEGQSIISLWIEKPNNDGLNVFFSGIIPNGFNGLIDPFNPKLKNPGKIFRLVFEAKNSGSFLINTSDLFITLNDGLGTANFLDNSVINGNITKNQNETILNLTNDSKPELNAYVYRDINLFNNKYVLIFDAKDTKTGIKEVIIKEGRRDWKVIKSPYLLEDQSRHSSITVQATNYSGSSIVINIEKESYSKTYIIGIFILLILLIIILWKFYVKRKQNKI